MISNSNDIAIAVHLEPKQNWGPVWCVRVQRGTLIHIYIIFIYNTNVLSVRRGSARPTRSNSARSIMQQQQQQQNVQFLIAQHAVAGHFRGMSITLTYLDFNGRANTNFCCDILWYLFAIRMLQAWQAHAIFATTTTKCCKQNDHTKSPEHPVDCAILYNCIDLVFAICSLIYAKKVTNAPMPEQ